MSPCGEHHRACDPGYRRDVPSESAHLRCGEDVAGAAMQQVIEQAGLEQLADPPQPDVREEQKSA